MKFRTSALLVLATLLTVAGCKKTADAPPPAPAPAEAPKPPPAATPPMTPGSAAGSAAPMSDGPTTPFAFASGPPTAIAARATKLVIYHLDDNVMTDTALAAESFESHPGVKQRVITDEKVIADALAAVEHSAPTATTKDVDTRWAMIFLPDRGPALLSVYVDKLGTGANIDRQLVQLDGHSAIDWLHAQPPIE